MKGERRVHWMLRDQLPEEHEQKILLAERELAARHRELAQQSKPRQVLTSGSQDGELLQAAHGPT